jgi:hypothetical protein
MAANDSVVRLDRILNAHIREAGDHHDDPELAYWWGVKVRAKRLLAYADPHKVDALARAMVRVLRPGPRRLRRRLAA